MFYGRGYCPCNDWYWQVKRELGETGLPASYIKYFLDLTTPRFVLQSQKILIFLGQESRVIASYFVWGGKSGHRQVPCSPIRLKPAKGRLPKRNFGMTDSATENRPPYT